MLEFPGYILLDLFQALRTWKKIWAHTPHMRNVMLVREENRVLVLVLWRLRGCPAQRWENSPNKKSCPGTARRMGKSMSPERNMDEAFWERWEGGREKVKPRGSQLAVTPALAVWRFLIEVTWLHGFWRAVRGQLQLRWRWNTKTGKYWSCRVCDCLSEQGLVGEKIGAGLLEVLSLKGLCCRYLTVSAQTAWLLFALTSVCVVPPSVTQKVLSGCAYHRLWGLICSVSPTHHVWFHPWARLGHAGWTSLGVIEPDAVLQAPLSNALPLLIGLQNVLLGCSKTPAVWARGPEHPLFHSSRPGLTGSHHSLGQTRISAERML